MTDSLGQQSSALGAGPSPNLDLVLVTDEVFLMN